MNKKQIYLGIGAAIIVGTTAFIIVRRSRNKKKIAQINAILDGQLPAPNNPDSSGQVIISQTDYSQLPAGTFPLKVGDKNKKVYDMQSALNRNFGTNLDLDGAFGAGTYDALCEHYFTICWTWMGIYNNEVSQSNFDDILNPKSRRK